MPFYRWIQSELALSSTRPQGVSATKKRRLSVPWVLRQGLLDTEAWVSPLNSWCLAIDILPNIHLLGFCPQAAMFQELEIARRRLVGGTRQEMEMVAVE